MRDMMRMSRVGFGRYDIRATAVISGAVPVKPRNDAWKLLDK